MKSATLVAFWMVAILLSAVVVMPWLFYVCDEHLNIGKYWRWCDRKQDELRERRRIRKKHGAA